MKRATHAGEAEVTVLSAKMAAVEVEKRILTVSGLLWHRWDRGIPKRPGIWALIEILISARIDFMLYQGHHHHWYARYIDKSWGVRRNWSACGNWTTSGRFFHRTKLTGINPWCSISIPRFGRRNSIGAMNANKRRWDGKELIPVIVVPHSN